MALVTIKSVDCSANGDLASVRWIDLLGAERFTTVSVSWIAADPRCGIQAGHYVDRVSGDPMPDADLAIVAAWLDAERKEQLAKAGVDDLFDRSER